MFQTLRTMSPASAAQGDRGVWLFKGSELAVPVDRFDASLLPGTGLKKPKWEYEAGAAMQLGRLMHRRHDVRQHRLHPIISFSQPLTSGVPFAESLGASAEYLLKGWDEGLKSGYGFPMQVRHLSLGSDSEWGPMVLAHVPYKIPMLDIQRYPHRKDAPPAYIYVQDAGPDAMMWYGVHSHAKRQVDRDYLMLLAGKRLEMGKKKIRASEAYPGDDRAAQNRRRALYQAIEQGGASRASLIDVVKHVTASVPVKAGDMIPVEPETLMMMKGSVDAFFVMDPAVVPLGYEFVRVRATTEDGRTNPTPYGVNITNVAFNRGPCLHFEGRAPIISDWQFSPFFPVAHESRVHGLEGAKRFFDVGNAIIDGTGYDRRHAGEGKPRFTMDVVSLREGQSLSLAKGGLHFVVNMGDLADRGAELFVGHDVQRSSVIPRTTGAALQVPETTAPHGDVSLFVLSDGGAAQVPVMVLSAAVPV